MRTTIPTRTYRTLADTLIGGGLATLASTLVLAWRGRADAGSAYAPINAVSHWIWPREALRRDDLSWRHTGTGGAVHSASAALWAAVYAWLRARRRRPTAANAVLDAAALTAVAAAVDLKLVPERLTPGFERRLQRGSVAGVYAAFGAALALAGWLALRRR